MQLKSYIERLKLLSWQPLAGYFAGFIFTFSLLAYRLGTLVPGFSASEKIAISISVGLKEIFSDPINGPYKFLQYLGLKSGHHGFIAMRLPSVFFGLLSVSLLFYIVKKWFNFRIALITAVMFATSSWFLHIARIATPDITMLAMLAPLAYSIWLYHNKHALPVLIIGALILVTILHIPGFIWFVIAGIFWQRSSLFDFYKQSKVPALLTILGCLVVLTPLLVTVIAKKAVLYSFFGLPLDIANTFTQIPKNIIKIPYQLMISGPDNPSLNLARLPLLDFFTAIMALVGAYSYAVHSKLRRSRLLLASIVLSCILIGLGGLVTINVLLPFIFLLVAGGLNYMIEQWFVIFPFNPFARNLATVLIVAAVLVTSFYHLNRYFIAWPQASTTKQTFNLQP